jgi:hypothetical protein
MLVVAFTECSLVLQKPPSATRALQAHTLQDQVLQRSTNISVYRSAAHISKMLITIMELYRFLIHDLY